MSSLRRNWLFAVAREFQIVALDPRLQANDAPAVVEEILARVPLPGTELERLVLDSLVWRLLRTAERRTQSCQRSLLAEALAVKVKGYLDSNFRARITYADVARRFGRNPQHLETLFKNSFRVSIRHYLTKLRLEAVSTQIRHGEKVESAALSVGWTKSTFFRARHRHQVQGRSDSPG